MKSTCLKKSLIFRTFIFGKVFWGGVGIIDMKLSRAKSYNFVSLHRISIPGKDLETFHHDLFPSQTSCKVYDFIVRLRWGPVAWLRPDTGNDADVRSLAPLFLWWFFLSFSHWNVMTFDLKARPLNSWLVFSCIAISLVVSMHVLEDPGFQVFQNKKTSTIIPKQRPGHWTCISKKRIRNVAVSNSTHRCGDLDPINDGKQKWDQKKKYTISDSHFRVVPKVLRYSFPCTRKIQETILKSTVTCRCMI